MKKSSLVGALGLVATVLASGHAFGSADTFANQPLPAGKGQPATTATGGATNGSGGTSGGEPAKAEPAKEKRSAAGYAYSDKPTRSRSSGPRARTVRTGTSAAFPSFTATEGGGSRIVVHLSSTATVEERKAAGSVTYILKGVHVNRWNDTNPLVTVHFNTPVSQARLVPHGADLHLVVDLRAASAPTFKVSPGQAQGAGAALEIDFPKGDYAVTDPQKATRAATPAAEPSTKPVAPAPTPAPPGPKP